MLKFDKIERLLIGVLYLVVNKFVNLFKSVWIVALDDSIKETHQEKLVKIIVI